MHIKLFFVLLLLGLPSIAIAKADLVVGVSILPQKYFVQRIAGNTTEVIVMVGSGYNPAIYEPRPKQLSKLSKASIYFLAGVPFEKKWVKVFLKNNPSMTQISMTRDISLRKYHESSMDKHSHDNEGHPDNVDPHFWLNPLLVKIAAKTVLDTLIQKNPEKENFYQKNYQSFVNDLEGLDKYIRESMVKTKIKNFSVFHPSWGYFADAYGLKQIAIEVQNRHSGAKTLNETIQQIRKLEIKVIFVQKQFSETDAEMIARETDAQLVKVDPLAENYIENMKYVAHVFLKALQ